MSKKTVPGILRFASMLFLIFEKGVIVVFGVCKYPFLIFNIKEVIGTFRICMYAFLTWLFFSMNGVIEIFGSIGKNVRVCRYAFYLFDSYE